LIWSKDSTGLFYLEPHPETKLFLSRPRTQACIKLAGERWPPAGQVRFQTPALPGIFGGDRIELDAALPFR
jgi:hypothetical protein